MNQHELADSTPIDGEWLVRDRRGGRVHRPGLALTLIVASVAGMAAGLTFTSLVPSFTEGQSSQSLVCGFSEAGGWGKIGSGVPSGTAYLTLASGTLNPLGGAVSSTASLNLEDYGTGAGGSQYLVAEVAFGCTSVPATGTTTVALSITSSQLVSSISSDFSSGGHLVVFVQRGYVDYNLTSTTDDPIIAGTQCIATANAQLWEPVDATSGFIAWAFDALSGTQGAYLSGLSCTLQAGSPTTTATSGWDPIWTISFVTVNLNVPSSPGSAITTLTLAYTATAS